MTAQNEQAKRRTIPTPPQPNPNPDPVPDPDPRKDGDDPGRKKLKPR